MVCVRVCVSACVFGERERKRKGIARKSSEVPSQKKKSTPYALSLTPPLPLPLSLVPEVKRERFPNSSTQKGKRNLSVLLPFFGFSLSPSLRPSPSAYLFYRGFYPSSCFKYTHAQNHTRTNSKRALHTPTLTRTHTRTHARERAVAKEAFLRQM